MCRKPFFVSFRYSLTYRLSLLFSFLSCLSCQCGLFFLLSSLSFVSCLFFHLLSYSSLSSLLSIFFSILSFIYSIYYLFCLIPYPNPHTCRDCTSARTYKRTLCTRAWIWPWCVLVFCLVVLSCHVFPCVLLSCFVLFRLCICFVFFSLLTLVSFSSLYSLLSIIFSLPSFISSIFYVFCLIPNPIPHMCRGCTFARSYTRTLCTRASNFPWCVLVFCIVVLSCHQFLVLSCLVSCFFAFVSAKFSFR